MQRLLFLVFLLLASPVYALPNPASVYCVRHGGTVNVSGELAGMCLFPDHSYCEEWSFFRGLCKPGKFFLPQKEPGVSHCARQPTGKE